MAKLTTKARKKLPAVDFAGPDRSYPVQDKSHARNALARVSQNGTTALKAAVKAKVHKKFPGIELHNDVRKSGGKIDGKAPKHRMDRARRGH